MISPSISSYHQQASALMMALMITAVVAALASALMIEEQMLIQQTQMTQRVDQFYLANQTLQHQAIQRLFTIWIKNHGQIKRMLIDYPPIRLKGFILRGSLEDAQGRFNINLLAQSANIPRLAILIMAVDSHYDWQQAMQIAQAVYQNFLPGARHHAHALSQTMRHASELRQVKGINAQLMQRLAPYLIALPAKTKINLNSAALPVLLSLMPHKKGASNMAQWIIACRRERPLSRKQLKKCLMPYQKPSLPLVKSLVTYQSHYFLLKAQMTAGEQRIHSIALIHIDASNKKWLVHKNPLPKAWVLWQSF